MVTHHYPELLGEPNRPLALLAAVVERTADLMAAWQSVGFCHGVMNTDNMSILGFIPSTTAPLGSWTDSTPTTSAIIPTRRPLQLEQPATDWLLEPACPGQCPGAIDAQCQDDPAPVLEVLQRYESRFSGCHARALAGKARFANEQEGDGQLAIDFLQMLAQHQTDFTIAFRRLCDFRSDVPPSTR